MPPRNTPRSSDAVPPTSFPGTSPPPSQADLSSWMLNATTKLEGSLGRFEGTLQGMQNQLNRIESRLEAIDKEVSGHGRWMHTLKAFGGLVAMLLVWAFVNAVWPWLKQKLGIP